MRKCHCCNISNLFYMEPYLEWPVGKKILNKIFHINYHFIYRKTRLEVVRLISSSVGPTTHWALNLAPWSGAPYPKWLVGPCHTALYKEGGGRRLASRGSPPAHSPPTFPSPIYMERSQWREAPPPPPLHFASLPKRRSPTWLADPAAPLPETVHLSSTISLYSHALLCT
jgi:hypothetical protein